MAVVIAVPASLATPLTKANALEVQTMSLTSTYKVHGNFILVGNGVLTATSNGVYPTNYTPGTNCYYFGTNCTYPAPSTLFSGNTNGYAANDFFNMVNVGGGNGVANSSSATFTVPSGATVVSARVLWSADTGVVNGMTGTSCTGDTSRPATVPSGSASTQSIAVTVNGTTASYAPSNYLTDLNNTTDTAVTNQPYYYSANANILSQFNGYVGNGSAATITVGNIWAAQGYGCYAGWSLELVYDYGKFVSTATDANGNNLSQLRTVYIYDGYERQFSSDSAVSIQLSGLQPQGAGAQMGTVAYEGDASISGDYACYSVGTAAGASSLNTYTDLANPLTGAGGGGTCGSSSDNYFSGYAQGATSYASYTGSNFYNASVSAQATSLPNLVAGDSVMNLKIGTTSDSYLLQNVVVSVPVADVQITKTAANGEQDQAYAPGATPTFRITLYNSGSVSITALSVTDAMAPNCARSASQVTALINASYPTPGNYLPPGGSIQYTCTGPAVGALSGYSNVASVTGQTGTGIPVSSSNTSTALVGAWTVAKTATYPDVPAGTAPTWTITIKNTGTADIFNTTVTDANAPLCTKTIAQITAGTTYTYNCTGPATSTGSPTAGTTASNFITASGSAQATSTSANKVPLSYDGTNTPATEQGTAVTLTKTANKASANTGETVTYSFLVKNVGTSTLNSYTLNDTQFPQCNQTVNTPLAAGATATLTCQVTEFPTSTSTGIINQASVTATPPSGTTVTANASATIVDNKSLQLKKTAVTTDVNGNGVLDQPDTVAYTFQVTNNGSTVLSNVTVSDGLLPGLNCTPIASLAVGASATLTCTGNTYTVKLGDVNNQTLVNSAQATGTAPDNTTTSVNAAVTLTPVQRPSLSFSKTASPMTVNAVGQTVTYTMNVSNNGNTTMTNVVPSDTLKGLSAISCKNSSTGAAVAIPASLDPGSGLTCTATYVVTQADLDNGKITNAASVTGQATKSNTVVAQNAAVTVTATQNPHLTLSKTANTTVETNVGQVITYTWTAKNDGNVTLTNVSMTDALQSRLTNITCTPGQPASLAPGATLSCTGQLTVTQNDLDSGSIVNTVNGSSNTPANTTYTPTPASYTITPSTTAVLNLTKTADRPSVTAVGQVITYTMTGTNQGTSTLNNVQISDTDLPGLSALNCSPALGTALAPGKTMTCTATYTTTQADLDRGTIANQAKASATSTHNVAVNVTANTAVSVVASPSISLQKSASPSQVSATTDVVTYTFVAKNTGNVTLTGVAVTDPLPGLSAPNCAWPGAAGTLAPNATVTCTATRTTTQADLNAGGVSNTATVNGTSPQGTKVQASSTANVTALQNPSYTIQKTPNPTLITAPQNITYSIVISNTGNVTLSNLQVSDPRLATLACSPIAVNGALNPKQSTTCTGTYTATQADVNAGSINNTATAILTPPTGSAIQQSSSATVQSQRTPGITVTKTGSTTSYSKVGDVITYTVTAQNTGNVTLSGVVVSDPMFTAASPLTCTWPQAAGGLDPTQTTTCTGSHTITQADLDSGTLNNTATGKGTGPSGATVQQTASFKATAVQSPAMTLSKTPNPTSITSANKVITYTLVATNTGNVTLSNVQMTDPRFASFSSCSPVLGSSLAPGGTMTCTGSYTSTQADVDAGSITNTATLKGNGPTGAAVTPVTSGAVVTVTQNPQLTLTKTANPTRVSKVGDVVNYTFVVQNTGNVTASNVAVTDAFTSGGSGGLSPISCPADTLAPGASTTCTASYTVTQADLNLANASINNTATANATQPNGQAFPAVTSPAAVTVSQTPSLAITKTATPTTVSNVGDTVSYTITVQNTGNVSVTNVTPTDNLVGTLACTPALGSTLNPGATMTCIATRAATQGDLDAGTIVNTASATGKAPNGSQLPAVTTQATVAAIQSPAIAMTKVADQSTVNAVGQTINYTYTVTNTGNVTVGSLSVADPMPRLSSISCQATSLAPNVSTTCTAHYSVTLADLNAGSITNTGTATAHGPGASGTVTAPASTVVSVTQSPDMTLSKSASQTTYTTLGRVITYTYNVQNTGNVSINNVQLSDPMPGLSALTCTPALGGTLVPAATLSCTATRSITQTDIDSGSVTNTATLTGTAPSGATITRQQSLTLTARLTPAITMTKTANPTSVTAAGQTITYSFLVTNTGNDTLTNVGVTDPLPGLSAVSCPQTTLAPTASTTCTATYVATQPDIDRGSIANNATASGTDPAGTVVTKQSGTTVQAPQSPALTLTKSVAPGTYDAPGQTLTYTYHVVNSGNVTMSALAINDAHAGLSAVTCAATTLAPGAATDCTATYVTTLADMNLGDVVNNATATATAPGGATTTSNTSTATATAVQRPSRTFTKTASPLTVSKVGDLVTYTLTVANTGNVTLGGIYISDPPLQSGANWTCKITDSAGNYLRDGTGPRTLNPGEIKTCTAVYTVTQADLDAGSIVNNATTTGTDTTGAALPVLNASATVTAIQNSAMTFTKTSDTANYQKVGQTVTYTFLFTNTGNTTLSNVQIVDPHAGLSALTCSPALGTAVAPKGTLRCTATYQVTQADIDALSINNTATATAQPPSGSPLSQTASVAMTATLNSSIDLSKSATPSPVSTVGQVVTYSFVVSNTGNSTLNNIVVSDPHPNLSAVSCPTTSLAPQGTTTCTATYTVTQADIDANSIKNTASVSATDPAGTAVNHSASATVGVTENPSLSLTKTANPTTVNKAGDQVTYTFVVTNTGNTTVNSIALTDPMISSSTLPCPQSTLSPGATMTCTATYTADQQDIDLGSFTNNATITGKTASGTAVTPGKASATVTAPANPSMTLAKTADTTNVTKIGQTVTYTITFTNTGNVTLDNVFLSDKMVGNPTTGALYNCVIHHLDGTTTVGSGPVVVQPGETKVCQGTKTFQQADFEVADPNPATSGIDWPNTVTATATDPHGTPVPQQTATATVYLQPSPDFKVVKSANATTYSYAGQVITYQVNATNTGNVALSNVQVIDQKLKGVVWSCTPALGSTLQPNQSMSCGAQYTVTQADIGAKSITNSAYGEGTDPQGVVHDSTSPGAWVLTLDTSNSGMTLSKLATPGSVNKAGDAVTYTFTVYNSGSSPLSGIKVNDTMPGLSVVTCPALTTVINPGQSLTCTATYTATQADIDAKGFSNSATATDGTGITSNTATTKVVAAYAPALSLVKSASIAGGKTAATSTSDVINYSFLVTNTGNVAVSGLALTDDMPVTGLTCPATTLAPGASMTCAAQHQVTQADLNLPQIVNNATVSGAASDGTPASAKSSATVATQWQPGVTLAKSVGPASVTTAGNTVTYTVTATNTGNVSLYNTFISDPFQTTSKQSNASAPNGSLMSKFTCDITDASNNVLRSGTGPVTLNPGEKKVCRATYTVTQSDIDAGSLNNTASVDYKLPDGSAGTTVNASATLTFPPSPSLATTKTVDTTTYTKVGQQLSYTYTVTNTGNVTAYNVTPQDTLYNTDPATPLTGLSNVNCSPASGGALAPGDTMTCTATYAVTQADLDAGTVTNAVKAVANTAASGAATPIDSGAPSTVVSKATTTATLTLFKTADATNFDHAGQVINYTFTVTNTGTSTLNNIAVSDVFTTPNVGTNPAPSVACPAGPLAPGAQVQCTSSYTVTQSDIDHSDSGSGVGLANAATATGTNAQGTQAQATTNLNIPVIHNPALTLSKTATVTDKTTGVVDSSATPTAHNVGDTINYTFVVTNTGNVDLQRGQLVDPMVGNGMSAITCDYYALEPGQVATCHATATVTQAMLDSGVVNNTATATGYDPDGDTSATMSSRASVTMAQTPHLTLTKSADKPTVSQIGELLTYTVSATNDGNVTLGNVFIADPLQTRSPSPLSKFTCTITAVDGTTRNGTGPVSLAPGEVKTCTATMQVSQGDINAGSITNTANVNATQGSGATIPTVYSNPVVVTAQRNPSLSVAKTVDQTTYTAVGQPLTYTIVVTNTGNTTLSNVTPTDSLPITNLTCTPQVGSSLDAGKQMSCTAAYAVTQADLDNRTINNVASATGTAPGNTPVSASSPTVTSNAVLTTTLSITKTPSVTTVTKAGQQITYTFEVTNTGNSTLTGVAVTDPLPGLSAVDCGGTTTIAPGQTLTCTTLYTVTQADIDNAKPQQQQGISNTATATGKDSAGTVATDSHSAMVQVQFQPALTVTKTADVPSVSKVGDSVTFTIVVANSGNVSLHGLTLADSLGGTSNPNCGATPLSQVTLAPNASVTCTVTYATTQGDLDNGTIKNTASATGLTPDNTQTQASGDAVVGAIQMPAMTLTKSATPTTVNSVGDVVTYTVAMKNTGNVTLASVFISDPLQQRASGPMTAFSCTITAADGTTTRPGTGPVTVYPGETKTCTATLQVTQSDLDAGSIPNTASVAATPPSGSRFSVDSNPFIVTAVQTASIQLQKSVNPLRPQNADDQLTYTFLVKNTGTVTLTNVAIDDPLPGLSGYTCDASLATLAPGGEIQCTATKSITAAEMNDATMTNTATVTADRPANNPGQVTSSSSATVTPVHHPSLALVKSHDVPSVTAAGQKVTYSFAVSNTGNIEVAQLGIDDPMLAAAGVTVTCPTTTLAVGASTTCTAVYTATQADLDRGRIDNSATTLGIDPIGGDPVAQGHATDEVAVRQAPALKVTKTPDSTAPVKTGDSVPFTIVATNTGNVTASSVQVTDSNTALTSLTCAPAQPSVLAPGESMTCHATVTATQDNFDFGSVDNHVDVNGVDPNGAPIWLTPPTASSQGVPYNADASVPTQPGVADATFTKTADKQTVSSVGDVITYTMKATNTGTYTIYFASITDPMPNLSSPSCDRDLNAAGLAPGDTVTCTAQYTVTQADLNAGSINNTSSFDGSVPPNFDKFHRQASATVTAVQQPNLTMTKTADRNAVAAVGDPITYTFNVRNQGNVSVSFVTIQDQLPNLSSFTCVNPDGTPASLPATLDPGTGITCQATYNVTQADLDAGSVVNSATASGKTNVGQIVDSPASSSAVQSTQTPGITVTKKADTTLVQTVGQQVTYTMTATNTGNVTIANATISDPMLPTLSCTPVLGASLAPQQTMTCTGTYAVQHTDLEAGKIVNTASFTGTDTNGQPVNGSATYTVPALYNPKMAFDKQVATTPITTSGGTYAATPANWAAGDSVTYTYHIENVGNMLANNVVGTDSMVNLSTLVCYAPAVTTDSSGNITGATPWMGPEVYMGDWMAPGEFVDCVATYKVTQTDVNRGYINNTATLTAQEATGQPFPTQVSSATTDTTQPASVSLVKRSATTNFTKVGDQIDYQFTVTNTSKVTVDSADVKDPLPGLSPITCPAVSLDPGQSTICTASYAVTQADLDNGYVENTATATVRDPHGTVATSAPSTLRITGTQSPSLNLTKDSQSSQVTTAGEHVTFTLTAKNTGNVTASNVVITDQNTNAAITSCDRPMPASLAPGEAMACAVDYVVSQAEINAGGLTNVANVVGQTPQGANIPAASASKTVTAQRSPSIALSKRVSRATVSAAGQVLTYTYTATNTGNTTLVDASITDPMPGLSALDCTPDTMPATIEPGQSITCTATYTVTLNDMNTGTISSVATVTSTMIGASPSDPTAQASADSAVVTTVDRQPALTLAKSADVTSVSATSDTINYTFVVTNSGNETVQDIVVADPLTASGMTPISCPAATLDPGASMTCGATYHPTQVDLDRGYIPNTATANGVDVAGNHAAEGSGSATVQVTEHPDYTVTKAADHSAISTVGDWVLYTYIAKNTGNVTLHVVTLADPMPGLTLPDPNNLNKPGTQPGIDCYPRLPANLPPGDQVICRAYYQVTQADLDRGSINNVVTLNGQDPHGTALPPKTAERTIYRADLAVAKTAPLDTVVSTLGQQVPYTIKVTNSGRAALKPVVVDDPMFVTTAADGSKSLTLDASGTPLLRCTYDLTGLAADPLAAALDGVSPDGTRTNSTMTCIGIHTVTQSDLDGISAFATPDGSQIVNPVTVTGSPVRGADGSTAAPVQSATAWPVPIQAAPKLDITKTSDVQNVKAVGDPINYTITVTNSGNVTLKGTTIADKMSGVSALNCSPAPEPAVGGIATDPVYDLAPGMSVTCTAIYAATQDDLDRGQIVNKAETSGTAAQSAQSAILTTDATNTVGVVQDPAMTVSKAVAANGPVTAGATLTYTFTVTNTGNVTANGTLTDPMPGLGRPVCDQPLTGMAPGAVRTCTATYTVTQADVDAGSIPNTAHLDVTGPLGQKGNGGSDSSAVIPTTQTATITFTKTGKVQDTNGNGIADSGETVVYTLTATNTGTVTLSNVRINDPMLGQLTCTPANGGTLAPREVMVCTGSYVVTDTDANTGSIVNNGTVTADSPVGVVNADGKATNNVHGLNPAVSLTKSAKVQDANNNGVAEPGETVLYTLTATNTGDVALTNAHIVDPMLPKLTCTPAAPATPTAPTPATAAPSAGATPSTGTTLAVGASMTCTGTYVLTAADAQAGKVVNHASVTADSIAHPVAAAAETSTVVGTVPPTRTYYPGQYAPVPPSVIVVYQQQTPVQVAPPVQQLADTGSSLSLPFAWVLFALVVGAAGIMVINDFRNDKKAE